MTKNNAISRLNSCILDDFMNTDFGANKTSAEIIKEGAFGGTYSSTIYSGINNKW